MRAQRRECRACFSGAHGVEAKQVRGRNVSLLDGRETRLVPQPEPPRRGFREVRLVHMPREDIPVVPGVGSPERLLFIPALQPCLTRFTIRAGVFVELGRDRLLAGEPAPRA